MEDSKDKYKKGGVRFRRHTWGISAEFFPKGDKVFAKLKGFAVWPAVISRREPVKAETYRVYFYGTYDAGTVKVEFIFPYNEENIVKYGKAKKPKFIEAMAEIESNFEIKEAGLGLTTKTAPHVAKQDISSEEDGELQIDEGLPPVLQREVPPTNELLPSTSSTPSVAKKAPAKTAQRRGSKTKKDSLPAIKNSIPSTPTSVPANVVPAAEEILTPAPAPTPQQEPEKLSRSGRKIKPKKFADDEEYETKVTKSEPRKSGGRGSTVKKPDDVIEGTPPVKRAKRGSISKKGSKIDEQVQNQDLMMGQKIKNESIKTEQPFIPPATAIESNLQKPKTKASRPPPRLIPTADISPQSLLKIKDSTKHKVIDDDKMNQQNVQIKDEIDHEKENLVEDLEEEDHGQFESQKEDFKRISIFDKKGDEIELTFDHEENKRKDFANPKEQLDWEVATSQNVLKIKNDLETQNPESIEMLEEIVNEQPPGETQDKTIYNEEIENDLKEKRQFTIRQLRVEGEMIEIIGEIVESLSDQGADCDKALELLERLTGHTLSTFMLIKHPEVLETIVKLRKFVGDPVGWGFTPDETEELALKTKEIRRLSSEIFIKIAETFDSQPDDDFTKHYYSEVDKFKEKTKHLPAKTLLSLVVDSSGKTLQLDIDSDDDDDEEEAEMTGEADTSTEGKDNELVDEESLLEKSELELDAMVMAMGQDQDLNPESDSDDSALYMDQKEDINGIDDQIEGEGDNQSKCSISTNTKGQEQEQAEEAE